MILQNLSNQILLRETQLNTIAELVEADVTYPGCKVLKYLLNVACYNPLLLKWQVVGRVMMSNLTTTAYTQAFDTLLKTVTKYYPEFESGKNIKVSTVDFADAQTKALEKFTENNSVHIRGCRVHFLRTVYKIAERVSENDAEKKLFLKIAEQITETENCLHIKSLFDLLCSNASLKDVDSSVIDLSEQEIRLECNGWGSAKKWTEWWLRPRHTKMICVSATDISRADWKISPSTTNAVEAQNRISVPSKITSLHTELNHIYRTDKSVVYESIAAEEGLSVAMSKVGQGKRQISKRKWRSKKSGLTAEDDQSKKPKISKDSSVDNLIDKKVLINTVGPRGKHYGYLSATVVAVEDDMYKAVYDEWPDHFTSFDKIDNDDVVLLNKTD